MAQTYPKLGYDFSGRRVLVTGGARGIGKSIATKFLELNAQVFGLGKQVENLDALTAEHPKITTIAVDLQNWEETRKAVESVLPIHHLVNNAGIMPLLPFLDIDLKHTDLVLDVNFKSALNVSQVVAKGMIQNEIKDGTIVSITSVADEVVPLTRHFGAYGSSKAALTMLTKTMAVELAPHGIRVNCVRPAFVKTELLREITPETQQKIFKPVLERMLFHKPIEPEEVANSVVFLSSPLSSSITGSKITIDQGYTAQ